MDEINFETALVLVQEILNRKLTEVQQAVFRGVWLRQSYQDIIDTAAENGHYYSLGHLKNTGSELWQSLSEALGERVTKTNLQAVLSRYQAQKQPEIPLYQDWGEAVPSRHFSGRHSELATLNQWLQEGCRVITLLGMGGMGKTSLAIRCAQDCLTPPSASSHCHLPIHLSSLFYRSLLNAPPIEVTLKEMLQFLSRQQEIDLPVTLDGQLARILHYLRQERCLLVLDNWETILQSGSAAGSYRPGYEGYGLLLQKIGEAEHQSSLLITSREKPREVAWLESADSPVRSLLLKGLEFAESRIIFQQRGCFGVTDAELQNMVEHYAGNPLALNMLASSVRELFDGDLSELLPLFQQGLLQFDDIQDVLNRQFERLSAVEREVIYWLAINREPVTHADLLADVVSPVVKQQLLQALKSLGRRCFVERDQKSWSLQPVVMEFVTNRLIHRACSEVQRSGELTSELSSNFLSRLPSELSSKLSSKLPSDPLDSDPAHLDLLNSHALLKAQAKDYIRQTQAQLILQPVLDCLFGQLGGRKNVEFQLRTLLESQRVTAPLQAGYLAGNVLNLLRQMGSDLSRIDCSHLTVWQADLQGTKLHDANFSHADFARSAFTAPLNATLAVAFSPDGRLFAAGNADGKVRVWRVSDLQALFTFEGHGSWVASIAFSPDSRTLASASFDQTIKIWSVVTGECLKTLQGKTNQLWAVVRFSPDGRWLPSAGDEQNAIKLWDVATGVCVRSFVGHTGLVLTAEFSPDGKLLASGGDDQMICIWDVQTGQLLQRLEGHERWVRSVAFGADGKTLMSSSNDHTIKCWDLATSRCLKTLKGHQHIVLSLALSADGRTLVSGSQDCTVRVWDLTTGQCLRVLQGHPNGIWSVAFHPDGETLISGSNDSMIKLWNVRTGHSLTTIQGYSTSIRTLCFSPDGQRLASAGDDKQIAFWDVQSGELLQRISGHTSWIWSVVFNSNGSLIASAGNDCSVRIWDAITGQVKQIMLGHTNLVMSVAFSPDDQILASGCTDQTIKLWDVESGRCLQTLTSEGRNWAVAFVDQMHLLSGHDDCTAKLWDWQSNTCLQAFSGHQGLVFDVAVSPDREWIATGSQDQTVKLWDLQSGKCLQTFICHSPVRSVAFSADGQLLIGGTSAQLVKLWQISSGKCVATLTGHEGEVWAVACSPDGLQMASGGQQGKIHLWQQQTGQQIKTLQHQRPYEGMNVTGITGVTAAQKMTLKVLGAVEE